jgi:hypothetical protein
MIRHERLDRDIRKLDVTGFVAHFPAWIDSHVFLKAHSASLPKQTPLNPAYGEIPPATPEELQTPTAASSADDAILKFGAIGGHKVPARFYCIPLLTSDRMPNPISR